MMISGRFKPHSYRAKNLRRCIFTGPDEAPVFAMTYCAGGDDLWLACQLRRSIVGAGALSNAHENTPTGTRTIAWLRMPTHVCKRMYNDRQSCTRMYRDK